ncbi:MAG: NADH-quinone oxidoreductase subunit NuoF [Acidimicrobiia bacterium]|nr:NADH-quinone oxidoreductase subunit NuoF [Acidimicrobiia bacterium]
MPEHRIITRRLRDVPQSWTLDAALSDGAYQAARKALAMEPSAVQEEVKTAGLRGRGGAGFPTGVKWGFLPEGSFPRYLVVNCDEGEPCTFKDRELTAQDPHQLIEGIIIASWALGVHKAFVYLRGEFAEPFDRLFDAVQDCKARGILGDRVLDTDFSLDIVCHRGAGAYICGEETALIESLEGERGMPRIKPPFPAIAGLYAKPTVVNNVETLSTVPHIVSRGGEWYSGLGYERSTGTRVVSLAGHVNRPGNYEIEFGCTFRDIIEEYGGGVRDGRAIKFVIPGGASSQWLVDADLDAIYDFEVAAGLGVMLGSGSFMVFDETTDPVQMAWRLAKFFSHESCGKCTPCREGTGWINKILYRILNGYGRPNDWDLLLQVGGQISPGVTKAPFAGTTICPLGPSCVAPVASLLKYFEDDVTSRLRDSSVGDLIPVVNADATVHDADAEVESHV